MASYSDEELSSGDESRRSFSRFQLERSTPDTTPSSLVHPTIGANIEVSSILPQNTTSVSVVRGRPSFDLTGDLIQGTFTGPGAIVRLDTSSLRTPPTLKGTPKQVLHGSPDRVDLGEEPDFTVSPLRSPSPPGEKPFWEGQIANISMGNSGRTAGNPAVFFKRNSPSVPIALDTLDMGSQLQEVYPSDSSLMRIPKLVLSRAKKHKKSKKASRDKSDLSHHSPLDLLPTMAKVGTDSPWAVSSDQVKGSKKHKKVSKTKSLQVPASGPISNLTQIPSLMEIVTSSTLPSLPLQSNKTKNVPVSIHEQGSTTEVSLQSNKTINVPVTLLGQGSSAVHGEPQPKQAKMNMPSPKMHGPTGVSTIPSKSTMGEQKGTKRKLSEQSTHPPLVYGMERSIYEDLNASGKIFIQQSFARSMSKSLQVGQQLTAPVQPTAPSATLPRSTHKQDLPLPSDLPLRSTISAKADSIAPKIVPETARPSTTASLGGADPVNVKPLKVSISTRDQIPVGTTSVVQSTRCDKPQGFFLPCAGQNCANPVSNKAAHARCRTCLGMEHRPLECPKCSLISQSGLLKAHRFFEKWRSTGVFPHTPKVKPTQRELSGPPPITRDLSPPFQLMPPRVAPPHELRAAPLAHKPLVTEVRAGREQDVSQGFTDAGLLTAPLQPASVQGFTPVDISQLGNVFASTATLQPSVNTFAESTTSYLSLQEKTLLQEVEDIQEDEARPQADFMGAMRLAGHLLNRQFVRPVPQQPQTHMATLQKPTSARDQCSVSLSSDIHTRVETLLTGEKVALTLDKEDVLSPWASLKNLYRVEPEDYRSLCDNTLSVQDSALPFVRSLARGTPVQQRPNVAGPLQQSTSMHARIATYEEILSTALHTFLSTISNDMRAVQHLVHPQVGQILENFIQSTEQAKPLASALADASRDHMRLASRGVARAIRLRRKAVIPKATGDTAHQILLSPPSSSCLMGQGFVDTHANRATLQSSVSTAAQGYLQVHPASNKPNKNHKKRSNPQPVQEAPAPKRHTSQQPFSASAPRGRGAYAGHPNSSSQTTTQTAQPPRGRGRGGRGKRGRGGRGGRGSYRGPR